MPDTTVTLRRPGYARAWLATLLLALSFALLPLSRAQAEQAGATFVFGANSEPNSFGARLGRLVYTEAFRRLGVPMEIRHYPLARYAAMVDAGEIDGDPARIRDYGLAHPQLVRVEESFMDMQFALYTAQPNLRLRGADELPAAGWRVEYQRGILYCENTLRRLVPTDRLSDISTAEQGLRKLLAGRTDLYCDLDTSVRKLLNDPAFLDAPQLRRALLLATLPTYAYLHPRHAELAPRLAAVLRRMKAEGLVESYRLQVEKELGWTR